MATKFLYPYWGSESVPIQLFIENAISQGFEGIEIHIPKSKIFEDELTDALERTRKKNPNFILVVQQVTNVKKETASEYLWEVLKRLAELRRFKPNFINSHTGKDYYSFEENCQIIEAIEDFSITSNVPV